MQRLIAPVFAALLLFSGRFPSVKPWLGKGLIPQSPWHKQLVALARARFRLYRASGDAYPAALSGIGSVQPLLLFRPGGTDRMLALERGDGNPYEFIASYVLSGKKAVRLWTVKLGNPNAPLFRPGPRITGTILYELGGLRPVGRVSANARDELDYAGPYAAYEYNGWEGAFFFHVLRPNGARSNGWGDVLHLDRRSASYMFPIDPDEVKLLEQVNTSKARAKSKSTGK